MAALRDALEDKPAATQRPPRLRLASRPARSCQACRYYKPLALTEGACRLYDGYRVGAGQTCDAWTAP
jgi:hypothetical protein